MNRKLSVFWPVGVLITLTGCVIGILNVLSSIPLPDYIFPITMIVGLLFLCTGKYLTEHRHFDMDSDQKALKHRAKAQFAEINDKEKA